MSAAMLNVHDLARQLADAAVGRIALREFEEWLVSRSWDVHDWGSPALQDAVYALELAFGEYSNGHRDATYIRVFCADLATQLSTTAAGVSPIGTCSLGRQVSSLDIAGRAIPADLLPLAA
jgi:hypothetical protein